MKLLLFIIGYLIAGLLMWIVTTTFNLKGKTKEEIDWMIRKNNVVPLSIILFGYFAWIILIYFIIIEVIKKYKLKEKLLYKLAGAKSEGENKE